MARSRAAVLGVLILAALSAGVASAASTRSANCAGYCLYTPTDGGWAFQAQFHARKNAPLAKNWLRLSNDVDWKLSYTRRLSVTRAELHLGTPAQPGRLVAVLCSGCPAGAHGSLRLSDVTLESMFAHTPLGGGLPVDAFVVLHTPAGTLEHRLRDL